MQISPRGAAVGALVGAAARAAVVGLHLGQNVLLVFVIPSAAIGLLVGAAAGGLGRRPPPWASPRLSVAWA